VNFRRERRLDDRHILGIKSTHGGGGGNGDFAEELRRLVAKDKRFQRENHSDIDGTEEEQQRQHDGRRAVAAVPAPQDSAAYAYCVVRRSSGRDKTSLCV